MRLLLFEEVLSGNTTVAGAISTTPTSVTVKDNANPAQSADVFGDNSFARTNVTLLNGNNTFTAVAEDSYGRTDTNTVTAWLPAAATCYYDLRGNLTNDGRRVFFYDDENQLTSVLVSNAWKSEFVYDGLMRRRVRKEYTWSASNWLQTNEVRYIYDGRVVLQERFYVPAAVDGTWTSAPDQANPRRLFELTKEMPRFYWGGPLDGPTGADSMKILLKVKTQICHDFCQAKKEGKELEINLTGWSRGAVIAMGVANLLNFPGCRCDGSGACGWFFGTRYIHIPVNWVGLFDAVSMAPSLAWVPHDVPSNVLRFHHAMKTTHSQPYFPTFRFNQPEEKFFNRKDGSPTTHADIGMSVVLFNNNDAYDWIKSKAVANGVSF